VRFTEKLSAETKGNGSLELKWSHDQWHYVTLEGHGRDSRKIAGDRRSVRKESKDSQ